MLWTAIRFEAGQPVAMLTRDHGYGLPEDQIVRWAGTFAQRFVVGHGPRIAPRLDLLADAADLSTTAPLRLGACAGAPLVLDGGTPFGAICAFHPTPLPEAIVLEQPALELVAHLLSTLWQAERRVVETSRLAEQAQAEAHVDPLTGLRNRRAWDHLLETEEDRCRRYGHPACVFVIDVDDLKQVNDTLGHAAGDELLRRTAGALQTAARNPDVVARVGGDEFAVLAVECDLGAIPSLLSRFEEVLARDNVQASIGFAMRNSSLGLSEAWLEADHSMYREKRGRVKLRQQLCQIVVDEQASESHSMDSHAIRYQARQASDSVLADDLVEQSAESDATQSLIESDGSSIFSTTSPTTVAVPQPSFLS
jgi:diguanylate cyclase (GGDEF)-like protein